MRLGVLGTGRVSIAHQEAIRSMPKDARLYAVCDSEEDRAVRAAESWGAERHYTSVEKFFSDPSLDAVIICLPNHLHCSSVIQAAKAGKHILVEKPMALNTVEAERMVRAADDHGVTLMVGQSRRFSRAIGEVRSALPSIGQLFRLDISFLVNFPVPATSWWTDSSQAGHLVLHLQGSHSVDTVVWLLDKIPDTVFSTSKRTNPLLMGEDETNVVLNFKSGELATIQLSLNTSPYLHETLFVGKNGSLRLFEYPTNKPFGFAYRLELNGKTILEEEQIPTLYANQLTEFLSAVNERREPLTSGRQVLRTMQVLDAIIASDGKGLPVNIEPQRKATIYF